MQIVPEGLSSTWEIKDLEITQKDEVVVQLVSGEQGNLRQLISDLGLKVLKSDSGMWDEMTGKGWASETVIVESYGIDNRVLLVVIGIRHGGSNRRGIGGGGNGGGRGLRNDRVVVLASQEILSPDTRFSRRSEYSLVRFLKGQRA